MKKMLIHGKTRKHRKNQHKLTLYSISILLIAFIVCWNCVAPVQGKTYYVDANGGNDAYSGLSTTSAWKSLTKVNNTNFSPGDYIAFQRGDTWYGSLVPRSSGTAGNLITFGAYGSGAQPIISGRSAYSTQIVGNCLVNINTKDYLKIDNLHLMYSKAQGVYLHGNADHNVISNLTIDYCDQKASTNSGNSSAGVFLEGASYNSITSNTIKNSALGIKLSGYNNALCSYNTISGNTTSYLARSGIILNGGKNIKNNIIEKNNVSYAHRFYGVPPADGASVYSYNTGVGNIIRYNKIYNGGVGSYMCGGIMIDDYSGATQVYYNIVYGHNGGGILLSGLGGAGGHKIYNNTCYNNDVGGWNKGEINLFRNVSNCTIKDNIFVATSGKYVLAASPPGSGNILDNNLYQGNSTSLFYWNGNLSSLTSYTQKTHQDTHSLNKNPNLVNPAAGDMHLKSTSPAINKGVYVGLTSDYYGKKVSGNPDLGVSEY